MIEINSWVSVGKVLPRPQSEGTQFKRAHSNEWKQKPLWIASNPAAFMILLEDNSQGAYCDTIKSSNYFSRCPRPITSPPLSGAVGSSSAAGSVWRNGGSSSAGVDSAPGLARGDALICLPWTRTVMRWCSLPIFALSRYPLSACNANKILPCCVISALLAIATLQKEVERMPKYQKNAKDALST